MRRGASTILAALVVVFFLAFQGNTAVDEARVVKLITNVGPGGV